MWLVAAATAHHVPLPLFGHPTLQCSFWESKPTVVRLCSLGGGGAFLRRQMYSVGENMIPFPLHWSSSLYWTSVLPSCFVVCHPAAALGSSWKAKLPGSHSQQCYTLWLRQPFRPSCHRCSMKQRQLHLIGPNPYRLAFQVIISTCNVLGANLKSEHEPAGYVATCPALSGGTTRQLQELRLYSLSRIQCTHLVHVTQASGILGNFDPCRCFRIRAC